MDIEARMAESAHVHPTIRRRAMLTQGATAVGALAASIEVAHAQEAPPEEDPPPPSDPDAPPVEQIGRAHV